MTILLNTHFLSLRFVLKTILLLTAFVCLHPGVANAEPLSTEQELAELKAQLTVLSQQVSVQEKKRLQSQSADC